MYYTQFRELQTSAAGTRYLLHTPVEYDTAAALRPCCLARNVPAKTPVQHKNRARAHTRFTRASISRVRVLPYLHAGIPLTCADTIFSHMPSSRRLLVDYRAAAAFRRDADRRWRSDLCGRVRKHAPPVQDALVLCVRNVPVAGWKSAHRNSLATTIAVRDPRKPRGKLL